MHDKQMNDASLPGPTAPPALTEGPHVGVRQIGEQGDEGRKAFYIHIEAEPGRVEEALQMLSDIRACVEDEPGTGPWFAVRFSQRVFGIFKAFPDIAGRQARSQPCWPR